MEHFPYSVRRNVEVIGMIRTLLSVLIMVSIFFESTSINKGHSEEQAEKEVADQLKGSSEDEALKVSLLAEIDADKKSYKIDLVITNKTSHPLDLLYDCGLLISNDKFASSDEETCIAVESMMLKKKDREERSMIVPLGFFGSDNNTIIVRYRQNSITKNLELRL
jgi:hypothetical protein